MSKNGLPLSDLNGLDPCVQNAPKISWEWIVWRHFLYSGLALEYCSPLPKATRDKNVIHYLDYNMLHIFVTCDQTLIISLYIPLNASKMLVAWSQINLVFNMYMTIWTLDPFHVLQAEGAQSELVCHDMICLPPILKILVTPCCIQFIPCCLLLLRG